MIINNINREYAQGVICIDHGKLIIFDLANVAGIFFKDDYVNFLLKNNSLLIDSLVTTDDEPANLLINLSIFAGDYYELKLKITTISGTECIQVYDELDALNILNLKKWIHTFLCDDYRKFQYIIDFPENHSFDYKHFLGSKKNQIKFS